MRAFRMTLFLLALLPIASACDGEQDTTATADTGQPQMCSLDCGPELSCRNGVVTAIPRVAWDGPCDRIPACADVAETYVCELGCGLATSCDPDPNCAAGGHCDLSARCAEGQPARALGACATDLDCAWTCAPYGDVPERYMRCETSLDSPVCVASEPPVMLADFGASCALLADDLADAYPDSAPERALLTEQDACQRGLCVVGRGDSCTYQACTVACETSLDCPVDWLCEALEPVDGDEPIAVCNPIDPSPEGSDLTCTP